MSAQEILDRLENVRGSGGEWRSKCPSHGSNGQTLSIKELDDGRILMHCFAGCSAGEIMESVGLTVSDLFEEPLKDRIVPLFMATERKKVEDGAQLRLDMARDMRDKGIKLTPADLQIEREAFQQLRGQN